MLNGYFISKDKSKLQIESIKDLMNQTYWASDRLKETITKAINNSICYGVFNECGNQIGFARVITDYSTTYYLCDVIIDKKYRGIGLGKSLLESIIRDENLKDIRGFLCTKDAHEFYAKYGFERNAEKFMQKPQN